MGAPRAARGLGALGLAVRGFELLREGRARQVLLSGGSLDPRPEAVVEAQVLSRQLQAWGIAPERILTEDRSRNTRENAVYSAHMPRAAGCFAAVGLTPDTLPVDGRAVYRWRGWLTPTGPPQAEGGGRSPASRGKAD